jgi:hypothetical protein
MSSLPFSSGRPMYKKGLGQRAEGIGAGPRAEAQGPGSDGFAFPVSSALGPGNWPPAEAA